MGPVMKGFIAGLAAFAATTVATIAATTAATAGRPADRCSPLAPGPAAETEIAAESATTRTELTIPVEGGSARGVLVEPADGAEVGVVLVAGAGASVREDLLAVAERFAAHGIAALAADKRAEGYSVFHRDYQLLASDALAAAEALVQATGVERVGAWGISEGGWVVADAAARPSSPLDFAVFASAPVVSPGEQSAWIVDRAVQDAPAAIRLAAGTVVGQGQFLLDYLTFDTRSRLPAIDVPVMAIWGADDPIVPVNEAYRRLEAGLGGRLSARIFPGLGHALEAEVDAWLPAVAAWIREPGAPGLVGVEPSSDLGVTMTPPRRWFADPRLHLAASAAVASIVGRAVARRAPRDSRPNSDERTLA